MIHFVTQVTTMSSLFLSLAPFIFLVFINFFIYKTIRKKSLRQSESPRRERREAYVATILISITVIYTLCHTITTFFSILELVAELSGILAN